MAQQPQMQPILDRLHALAKWAQTPEEFVAGLPGLLDDILSDVIVFL